MSPVLPTALVKILPNIFLRDREIRIVLFDVMKRDKINITSDEH